jgi:hypothetical protein
LALYHHADYCYVPLSKKCRNEIIVGYFAFGICITLTSQPFFGFQPFGLVSSGVSLTDFGGDTPNHLAT